MASSLDEILAAFAGLVAEREDEIEAEEPASPNFRCVDCVRCSSCRFCTACEGCEDCTYCDACVDCLSCTQSRDCHQSENCSHSQSCAQCSNCSYVTLCFDCEDCVYCFASVGLQDEEFCILNEKYSKSEYFKKVAELEAALDAKVLEGWRPPWVSESSPPRVVVPEPSSSAPRRDEGSGSFPRRSDPEASWPPVDHVTARALDRKLELADEELEDELLERPPTQPVRGEPAAMPKRGEGPSLLTSARRPSRPTESTKQAPDAADGARGRGRDEPRAAPDGPSVRTVRRPSRG